MTKMTPRCHRDRRHYAFGLCSACYQKDRYRANPADQAARRKKNLERYHANGHRSAKKTEPRKARALNRKQLKRLTPEKHDALLGRPSLHSRIRMDAIQRGYI
jgi:hypothetical protein